MKLWVFTYEDSNGNGVQVWCPTKSAGNHERKQMKTESEYVPDLRSVIVPTDRRGLAQFLTDFDWH